MSKTPDTSADVCPVDEKTRQAWLNSNSSKPAFPGTSIEASQASKGNNCDSSMVDQSPPPSTNSRGFFSRFFTSSSPPSKDGGVSQGLGTDREISTIPRASPVDESEGGRPANSEAESGAHKSGNWVYPSEKQFFEAMKRKGYKAEMKDMQTVVPVHNAVNERAWKEIKEWERPYGAEKQCGGPRLYSFLGLSTTMSPKARFNTILGYTPPFDRHDWVIDRCGTKVEYIIDFYAGRDEGLGNGKLNFFLDVRPKLNTWEGWRMRASKALGLV